MSAALTGQIDWHGSALRVDFAAGRPISIPLDPHGPQPSFFTPQAASARPLAAGDYIGDVRQGGSCNAEVVELAPHCHGTHTECVGHLLPSGERVQDVIYPGPTLARLVSLSSHGDPGTVPELNLDWPPASATGVDAADPAALVIRTLPNDTSKQYRDYAVAPDYPVLDPHSMAALAASPLQHLLIDTPSLDPANDGGRLANHRAWWGLSGVSPPPGIDAARRSVTEMIYVPDELADGLYWLHLELSPLLGDATPSRPVLYPVEVLA